MRRRAITCPGEGVRMALRFALSEPYLPRTTTPRSILWHRSVAPAGRGFGGSPLRREDASLICFGQGGAVQVAQYVAIDDVRRLERHQREHECVKPRGHQCSLLEAAEYFTSVVLEDRFESEAGERAR